MDPVAGGSSGALRQVWESGRVCWPALELSFEDFARLAPPYAASDPGRVHAQDLLLATACLAAVPGAATALERKLRADLESAIARVEARPDARREVAQETLVALLVGENGSGPRLRGYSGRGPLRAWARMVAVRRALNAARDATRHARIEARLVQTVVRASLDPELALLKAEYREDLALAFREALAHLDPRARTLLRLHYGEGLHLDGIAALHGWSKATASRRVAAARGELLSDASSRVRERLRLSASELRSLLRVMRSDLEARLSGLLGSGPT
jgi:RNA polymerase sigma-70 factor (ECF subfamily)